MTADQEDREEVDLSTDEGRKEFAQWLRDDSKRRYDVCSEKYEQLSKQSGNPIYAFLMISELFSAEMRFRHSETIEHSEPPSQNGTLSQTWADGHFKIPGWVQEYLCTIAIDLSDLAEGRDPERCPNEPWTSSWTAAKEADQEAAFAKWLEEPTLSAAEAMRRITDTMKLTRPSWNAFANHRKNIKLEGLLSAHQYLREEGIRDAKIIEYLMTQHALENERSARRMLADARALLGKNPDWLNRSYLSETAADPSVIEYRNSVRVTKPK